MYSTSNFPKAEGHHISVLHENLAQNMNAGVWLYFGEYCVTFFMCATWPNKSDSHDQMMIKCHNYLEKIVHLYR